MKVNVSSQLGSRLSFTTVVLRFRLLSGSRWIFTKGDGRCEAGLATVTMSNKVILKHVEVLNSVLNIVSLSLYKKKNHS